ncbi:hypothetical protein MMC10_006547 [Thelotrema lepadinum]|nr:hypothetical protein [Thelotrema lepadinum]
MAPIPKSSLIYLDLSQPAKRSSSTTSSSPLTLHKILHARDAGPNWNPGSGSVGPSDISNSGMMGLFAILGAAFVLASIWFFFWAKNGGFRWRKNDWSDYKSTVLRRKGPNGTTLSNATRSTKLGDGSIVGSQGSMSDIVSEKAGIRGGGGRGHLPNKKSKAQTKNQRNRSKGKKNKEDADVRAYRHEKVAKVGGLNREAEGSYHEWTNTAPSVSDTGSHAPLQKPSRGAAEPQRTGNASKPTPRQFSYAAGTESRFSVASDDSHRPLRTAGQTPGRGSPRHSRQPSPTKNNPAANRYSSRTSMPGSYTDPLDFDSRYDGSQGGSEQSKNTKAYFHPIPGLSKGPAATGAGFRRGNGRRDSLSDSEGDSRRF